MPSLLAREDLERFTLSVPFHYGGIQSLLENMCLMRMSIIRYSSYQRESGRLTKGSQLEPIPKTPPVVQCVTP